MNKLITGKGAPKWYYKFLGSARLIGLSKPGKPGDIRPIAMGGTLPKLISRCLHRLLQASFDAFFTPYQFGVGMQRGSETIFKRVEEVRECHPERLILKIDFTNAFNTIDRTVVLKEVHQHFPSLLPWVQARYESPTILWAKGGSAEPCCQIMSQEGTQQGDPLAGFLFAVAAHTLLKSLNANMDREKPIANAQSLPTSMTLSLKGNHKPSH